MGVKIEFNPDLALRNFTECENGNRKSEECIPKDLEAGKVYTFLKSDHRNYFFDGEVPLLETQGNGVLSRPKASILMIEATHFLGNGKPFTKGFYKVVEVFSDDKIHFEGFEKIN